MDDIKSNLDTINISDLIDYTDTNYTGFTKVPIKNLTPGKKVLKVRHIKHTKDSIILAYRVWKKTMSILDNKITYRTYRLLDVSQTALLRYRDYQNHDKQNFTKKYTKGDLLLLALELPRTVKLTYPEVQKFYIYLSKNQCYNVIEIKKKVSSLQELEHKELIRRI